MTASAFSALAPDQEIAATKRKRTGPEGSRRVDYETPTPATELIYPHEKTATSQNTSEMSTEPNPIEVTCHDDWVVKDRSRRVEIEAFLEEKLDCKRGVSVEETEQAASRTFFHLLEMTGIGRRLRVTTGPWCRPAR